MPGCAKSYRNTEDTDLLTLEGGTGRRFRHETRRDPKQPRVAALLGFVPGIRLAGVVVGTSEQRAERRGCRRARS